MSRQCETCLDRFDHERADVLAGRLGLGSESLFDGRWGCYRDGHGLIEEPFAEAIRQT